MDGVANELMHQDSRVWEPLCDYVLIHDKFCHCGGWDGRAEVNGGEHNPWQGDCNSNEETANGKSSIITQPADQQDCRQQQAIDAQQEEESQAYCQCSGLSPNICK